MPRLASSTALLAACGLVAAAIALPRAAAADPRVRGGFSLNGGYFGTFANRAEHGGSISLGGRIGVQITDVFSLYYQNTPLGFFQFKNDGPRVGAADFNTVLVDFTIADVFGVGFGPSFDLVTSGSFSGSPAPYGPGGHARISLLLGSSSGISRRQSFAIGLDPHITYFNEGALLSLAAGIGAEWY